MEEQRPLFGARLPFLQFLHQNHATLREATQGATYATYRALGHYHQMMVLAAGIAGVVVPVIYTQDRVPIDPRLLRWTAICMGTTVVVGTLIVIVARWLLIWISQRLEYSFVAVNQAVGEVEDDEPAIARAIDEARRPFKFPEWFQPSIVVLGAIGDVLFYGSFLTGIGFLIAGFVRS